jgi:hypothetical protein
MGKRIPIRVKRMAMKIYRIDRGLRAIYLYSEVKDIWRVRVYVYVFRLIT